MREIFRAFAPPKKTGVRTPVFCCSVSGLVRNRALAKFEQNPVTATGIIPFNGVAAKNTTSTAFQTTIGHQGPLAIFLDSPATGRTAGSTGLSQRGVFVKHILLDADVGPVGIDAVTVLKEFFFNFAHDDSSPVNG